METAVFPAVGKATAYSSDRSCCFRKNWRGSAECPRRPLDSFRGFRHSEVIPSLPRCGDGDAGWCYRRPPVGCWRRRLCFLRTTFVAGPVSLLRAQLAQEMNHAMSAVLTAHLLCQHSKQMQQQKKYTQSDNGLTTRRRGLPRTTGCGCLDLPEVYPQSGANLRPRPMRPLQMITLLYYILRVNEALPTYVRVDRREVWKD